jgi:hypothetical protein
MNRMPPKFPTVLTILALCALVAAGCGSKSASENLAPEAAVQQALEKTSTITSGHAELSGTMTVGAVPGSISLKGGGPFDTKAPGGGAFKIELSLGIAGSEQKLGFAYVDGSQYMLVGDKAIEQKDGKGGKKMGTGQVADIIKDLGSYVSGAKKTAPNTYTAKIDVKKMFEERSKKAGAASDLEIPGIGSPETLAKSMGIADITVTVNADGYAETMDLNLPINSDGNQGGLRLKIALSEINEPQKIEKPTNVVTGADALGSLGSSMLGN